MCYKKKANTKMRVTGNMVNYYFVCKRKLWLFTHQIQFEETSQKVQLGNILDKTSYVNEGLHHVAMDNQVNIDLIQNWQTVHEVKKSNAIEPAAIWQLKYYIYYLRKKGINISKGLLDYPLLKKCVKVDYMDNDQRQMEKYIADIKYICEQKKPEKPHLMPICKSCAFYEYCFSK
ncbi:CRISPR-associated protein Cas4 [Lactobacillus sp. LL6]|uniref:CRISPR-associated protein Cas4 n=1 Tax=Lactobacillus sp. LL6 TaxID=2596827 RepID=UPI001F5B804A|nr:CRISPR-associated protein Cas4 [Lactobacillus sp. LL6]